MATSLAHLQHSRGSQASRAKSGAFKRAPQHSLDELPKCPHIDWNDMAQRSSSSCFNDQEPPGRSDLQGGLPTEVLRGYEPDDGPLSPTQIAAVQAVADEALPKGAVVSRRCLFPQTGRRIL